jgi:molybdenum cofactor guanylyltransferase
MNSNVTAIILSGGKSLRFGEDKALLKLKNISIIESIYSLLNKIFNEIIIISNEESKYKFLTDKIYNDVFPGFGPLSGIHSGLVNSKTKKNFIISCDMPMISEELVEFLISQNSDSDIFIPTSNSNYHTLCAVYKKSCLPIAEKFLISANEKINIQNGKTKIKLFDLINSVNTKFIDISEEKFFNMDLVFNMNTLDDYEYVKNKVK